MTESVFKFCWIDIFRLKSWVFCSLHSIQTIWSCLKILLELFSVSRFITTIIYFCFSYLYFLTLCLKMDYCLKAFWHCSLVLRLNIFFSCMYVCVCVYVSAGAHRGNEDVGLLKLEVYRWLGISYMHAVLQYCALCKSNMSS